MRPHVEELEHRLVPNTPGDASFVPGPDPASESVSVGPVDEVFMLEEEGSWWTGYEAELEYSITQSEEYAYELGLQIDALPPDYLAVEVPAAEMQAWAGQEKSVIDNRQAQLTTIKQGLLGWHANAVANGDRRAAATIQQDISRIEGQEVQYNREWDFFHLVRDNPDVRIQVKLHRDVLRYEIGQKMQDAGTLHAAARAAHAQGQLDLCNDLRAMADRLLGEMEAMKQTIIDIDARLR